MVEASIIIFYMLWCITYKVPFFLFLKLSAFLPGYLFIIYMYTYYSHIKNMYNTCDPTMWNILPDYISEINDMASPTSISGRQWDSLDGLTHHWVLIQYSDPSLTLWWRLVNFIAYCPYLSRVVWHLKWLDAWTPLRPASFSINHLTFYYG